MVYFTCNNCGDALQKPKVQKHYQMACFRNPVNITCADCHKDFNEITYLEHTKCVSELERYSDKNFKGKVNKGEEKQTAWTEAVQSLITEITDAKPAVRDILKKISSYDNVPRKKIKFLNFMKNCAGAHSNDPVLEEVWALLEEKQKVLREQKEQNKTKTNENSDSLKEDKQLTNGGQAGETINKKSSDEGESHELKLEQQQNEVLDEKANSKKRKIKDLESPASNKTLKLSENENNDCPSQPEVQQNGIKTWRKIIKDESCDNEGNSKFEWKKQIIECLASNDNEMSMKKLRKKIIENYLTVVDFDKYFMKKIYKIKGLTITDDVVMLEN